LKHINNRLLSTNILNIKFGHRFDHDHWQKQTLLLFAYALVVGMIFSPFLLSVAIWGFVIVAFWNAVSSAPASGSRLRSTDFRFWLRGLQYSFRRLADQKHLAILSLLFAVPAFSFFWSEDTAYWLERVRVRLPFFVLPWAFSNLPALSMRQYNMVLHVLVWVLTITCIGIGIHYLLHADEILLGLSQGQPVPVPRHHIRFNLTLVTGILSGARLWATRFAWRFAWERRLLGLAVLFLFAFIHVLSVRSGLAALYTTLLFSLVWFVAYTRRWRMGIAAVVLLGLTPLAALKTLPSLRTRMEYMVYDWKQYKQQNGQDYSDSERWVSLHAGWILWRENPALGVGVGDLPFEIHKTVNTHFPQYAPKHRLPHNQFVYILVGTGLMGLALSLIAFLGPVLEPRNLHFYLFSAFQIVVFVSFLVEYTIETSIGVAFYLFYMLWFRQMARADHEVN
jgi:O-antigen ligase